MKMVKKLIVLFFIGYAFSITCPPGYSEHHGANECIPENFYYNSSIQQAAYFFLEVSFEGLPVSANDWVGAFNNDICVGARKWDTNQCGNGVCEVPVLGQDSQLTQGYMSSGVIPTFKLFQASDLSYVDAIPSEEIPWFNFATPIINSLSASSCIGTIDCAGICDGTAVEDCAGECDGNNFNDACGICDSNDLNNNSDWDDDGICDNIDLCIGEEDDLGNCIVLKEEFPQTIMLKQNYPNPFNPTTYLEFEIGEANHASLIIYDLKGNPIKKLIDRFLPIDSYRVSWDGKDENYTKVPSGAYIASLEYNYMISSKKLTLIK